MHSLLLCGLNCLSRSKKEEGGNRGRKGEKGELSSEGAPIDAIISDGQMLDLRSGCLTENQRALTQVAATCTSLAHPGFHNTLHYVDSG